MLDDIKGKIIGGVIVLVIGGTGFAVSQTDVINNFAKETGMSQEQAQQYADSIKNDLDSFSNIGKELVGTGGTLVDESSKIDCDNYTYEWETPSLSCADGKSQMQKIGQDEQKLGECYKALDTDLGAGAKPKMQECINDLDTNSKNLSLPMNKWLLDDKAIEEMAKTNAYNKSILQTALNAE